MNPQTPGETPPSSPYSPTPPQPLRPPVSPDTYTPVQPPLPPRPIDPLQAAQNDALAGFPSPIQPKKSKKKLIIISIIVAVLIIAGAATYVFAFYIPNKPENVWRTSMERSGQAVDKLVAATTEPATIDSFEKSDMNLTIDADFDGSTYNGSLKVLSEPKEYNAEMELAAEGPDDESLELSAKLIAEILDTSRYPNIYLQVTGLKALGDNQLLAPEIAAYDGKWIAIESTYFESLGLTPPPKEDATFDDINSEDVAELSKAVTTVTVDRVLSTDPSKAVFENRSFVNKEEVDGKKTYHYKVGINKNNLREYCKAVVGQVMDTSAYQKISAADDAQIVKDKEKYQKECADMDLNSIKDDQTYDVWVDMKYKLLYKVRIPTEGQPGTYTDIGQNYSGGDEAALFVKYHNTDDQVDANFTMTINTATSTTTGKFTYENTDPSRNRKVTITLDAKPYKGEIDTTKPAGAVPIQEVLQKIGLDPAAQARGL